MTEEYPLRTIDEYPAVNPFNGKRDGRKICWWSGGVASAVACKLVLDQSREDVVIAFCDTHLEHPDTYRFMQDFEKVLGVKVEILESERMHEPEEVWRRYLGLNFANGAPCSMVLKKEPRIKFQDTANDFCQVFGFDYRGNEIRRAERMLVNNPDLNPVFPLIVEKYDRDKIFATLSHMGIKPPVVYKHFLNNNCIGAEDSPKGGCIQGGVGYWQKIRDLYPHKFDYMAQIEHELSTEKGSPVTINRDYRNGRKGKVKLFLKPHPEFPDIECIDVIKGRKPVTPFECNGFCSTMEMQFD